jgi:SHS2 domain-containing protein
MKAKGYEFLDDLTSDVMFEAHGRDLKEVFRNAAEALFEIICKKEQVKHESSVEVEVHGKDLEELMVNWLQELIGLVDTEEMFFSKFDIMEADERHVKAVLHGDKAAPELGETVVKAVTYYKYKFEKTRKGYVARISLDI